jgi:hypothetical protein
VERNEDNAYVKGTEDTNNHAVEALLNSLLLLKEGKGNLETEIR